MSEITPSQKIAYPFSEKLRGADRVAATCSHLLASSEVGVYRRRFWNPDRALQVSYTDLKSWQANGYNFYEVDGKLLRELCRLKVLKGTSFSGSGLKEQESDRGSRRRNPLRKIYQILLQDILEAWAKTPPPLNEIQRMLPETLCRETRRLERKGKELQSTEEAVKSLLKALRREPNPQDYVPRLLIGIAGILKK